MKDLTVAILAGGLATRMRPMTEKIPKSMLEVAGAPFIDSQLSLIKKKGFENVLILNGYLGEQIEKHIGDGSQLGLNVKYKQDGPVLLGTGGALNSAIDLLSDPFIVIYGDSYLDTDYKEVLKAYMQTSEQQKGPLALMTVFKNKDMYDKSNVQFESGKIIQYVKDSSSPELTYIDWGLGIINKEALLKVGKEKFDLAELYQKLLQDNELVGFEVKERFYEIGSKEGLAELNRILKQQ